MEFSSSNIRMWSRLGSCGAYGMAMMELPELDEKTVACTADLCFYSGLDRFKQKYPDRLYNVGIAEQNLVGIAAGLAKEGFNPFVSTYASFATSRALDQVRTNMGYMQLPIKLIGLTSGLSVGILGATHISMEDIAIMRAIPNVTIISPADCTETVKATMALAKYDKPVYLRLTGGMNNDIVYKEDYDFQIGKANELQSGSNIAIIATGTMVSVGLKVAKVLEESGLSCMVADMHTIKPLDTGFLLRLKTYDMIVSIEEHSKIGGLGSAIAEFYSDKIGYPPLKIYGLEDYYAHAAQYEELLSEYHLQPDELASSILQFYTKSKESK